MTNWGREMIWNCWNSNWHKKIGVICLVTGHSMLSVPQLSPNSKGTWEPAFPAMPCPALPCWAWVLQESVRMVKCIFIASENALISIRTHHLSWNFREEKYCIWKTAFKSREIRRTEMAQCYLHFIRNISLYFADTHNNFQAAENGLMEYISCIEII